MIFLNNNKGFSLLEVLVAVSIIGIISAIAVPAFQDYRANASKVAGNTSLGNIYRAFQNCIVLESFDDCASLSDLGINCPDCTSENDLGATPKKFCAHIKKEVGGESFAACISVEGAGGTPLRTYGGDLLANTTICHHEAVAAGTATGAFSETAMDGAIECTSNNIATKCGTQTVTGTPPNTLTTSYSCKAGNKNGECNSSTKLCD